MNLPIQTVFYARASKLLIVCMLLWTWMPQPASAQPLLAIDSGDAPWPSVGRLNIAGFDRLAMCTATLVSPTLVLTAAHCLFDAKTGQPYPINKLRFVAGVRRDQNMGTARAKCARLLSGYQYIRRPTLKDTAMDVAVLVLDEAMPLTPVATLSSNATLAMTSHTRLRAAGYRQSRKFLPTLDDNCVLDARQSGVWVTSCSTEKGASGGPVFVEQNGEWAIAAVMSASLQRKRSVAVPYTTWESLLIDTSCKAGNQ